MPVKKKYDAFLSHNNKDKPQVEQIAKWLEEESNLKVWLDKWNLIPGDPWQEEIENALDQSRCCVVCIGSHGLGSWQHEEMRTALNDRVSKESLRIVPVLLPKGKRPKKEIELPKFLQRLTWVKFNMNPIEDIEALSSLVSGIRGIPIERKSMSTLSGTNEDQFLIGAILYANVMGFSNLYCDVQDRAAEFMRNELEEFTNTYPVSWLDFKEGECLIFLEQNPQMPRLYTLLTVFLFGLQLQMKTIEEQFKIGITLHWGGDAYWSRIGSESYLIGSALSEAKRIMSFSGKDHFFLSIGAFDILQLENSKNIEKLKEQHESKFDNFKDQWSYFTEIKNQYSKSALDFECTEFTFYDRHKRKNILYNFYIDNDEILVGNRSLPQHLFAIEYRDKRETFPNQKFIQRLVEASRVCIIGLTHEGTPYFLKAALNLREKSGKGFWHHLQIIFPSESTLNKIVEKDRSIDERKSKWVGGKRGVYTFLIGQGQENLDKWECLEYDGNFPFVGDKCLIDEIESFRVAFVLPGHDMRYVYTSEVFQGTKAFTQLSDALTVITNTCSRFIEWTIYGSYKKEKFHHVGLVNRKRLKKFVEANPGQFCFPVVLVMLHATKDGKKKSILQLRTIFNANSDLNTYSNISGRIIDRDAFAAQNKLPPDDYLKDYYSLRFEGMAGADDIITNEFNKASDIIEGEPLPEDIWKKAAVREVREELGLNIDTERLKYQTEYLLEREEMRHSLFFKIYSLRLEQKKDNNELENIHQARTHASLQDFDLTELKEMHKKGKFNALLQRRFEEVFLPIFKERLKIAE